MSKKLLMNNQSEKDEIILCKNYSPNGQPFYLWQDKMIDWEKYELYINIDISAITNTTMKNILIISSTDITSWGGTGKIHLYCTTSHFRIQAVNNGADATKDLELLGYNKERIQVVINKNGVYLEEKLVLSANGDSFLRGTFDMLKNSNVTIGSAIPINLSICTYNKVSLRKYIERG